MKIKPESSFSINSKIEFEFKDSSTRDFAHESFLPELERVKTKRSEITMLKENTHKLVFTVRCADITAFRASMSDIVGFGKIIQNTTELVRPI